MLSQQYIYRLWARWCETARAEHIRETISPQRASMSPACGISDSARTQERSIATTPKLLSQVASRDRELTFRRVSPCSLTEAGSCKRQNRPVGTTGKREISVGRRDWNSTKMHAVRGGMRRSGVGSSETLDRARYFAGYGYTKLRANRGPAPSSRSYDFFFSIQASRTIEQRLASTTRFRIVVCGRSTSPRKVAFAAATRSHRTPCLYRYARGPRLQVDPEKTWGNPRNDRFIWYRGLCALRSLKRSVDRRWGQRRTHRPGIPRFISIRD